MEYMEDVNAPSVYMIRNRINGKVYIGSATNPHQRISEHYSDFKKKNHHNSYLQNAWDKYGKDNFEFSILEKVEEAKLIEREQYYINFFNSYDKEMGYNICPTAGNSLGRIVSEYSRRKQSLSMKSKFAGEKNPMYGRHHTIEARKKIAEGRADKYNGKNHPMYGKHHSEEAKRKISEHNKRYYKNHPNPMQGKPSPMRGRRGLLHPLYGKKEDLSHKEWRIDKQALDWEIENPGGKIFIVHNLSKFCRENNLGSSSMIRVAQGKRNHHKNWKCRGVKR